MGLAAISCVCRFFIASAAMNGDILYLIGSIVFLFACLIFILPILTKRIKDDD